MNDHPRRSITVDPLRRLLATGCAALVFTLGVLASSPALHALVHGHASRALADDSGHTLPGTTADVDACAVVLFAQGVSLAADTASLTAQTLVWHELQFPAVEELLLPATRYRHQPERGPPVV